MQHGHIMLAANGRHLQHADGTPFFWLADTAWNGPLRATDDAWQQYTTTRTRQKFSAVQWVTTPWRAAASDLDGRTAFVCDDYLAVSPAYFQRLDGRVQQLAAAGLLNVPVLLWAIRSGDDPSVNPGVGLTDEQAILLARYMVARWGGYPTLWILPGDGRYEGAEAARWRTIGQQAFDLPPYAPVALHLCGQHFPADEFRHEAWLDILGYQSGHGDSDQTVAWLTTGPPAGEWQQENPILAINFEPAYENHVAYQSKQPHSAHSVRKATYWSLLNAPTAGVSYGGHGVWGWDDGTTPPKDHPASGIPLPWPEALVMPAAAQMDHLHKLFTALNWWQLVPAPALLLTQPGDQSPQRHILVSANTDRTLIIVFTPEGDVIELDASQLDNALAAHWFDPRTGDQRPAHRAVADNVARFAPPMGEDWLLVLR